MLSRTPQRGGCRPRLPPGDPVETALDLTRVAMAGEAAGGARRALGLMTVDYAKTRAQFGRLIGSFQAIKHMAADLLLDRVPATSAARGGRLPAPPVRRRRAGHGQPRSTWPPSPCADAYTAVTATGVQMHGGIAFTLGASGPPLPAPRPRRAPSCSERRPPIIANAFLPSLEPDHGGWRNAVTDETLRDEVRAWLAEATGPAFPARSPAQAAYAGPSRRSTGSLDRQGGRRALGRAAPGRSRMAGPRPAGRPGPHHRARSSPPRSARRALVRIRSNLWANTALAYATPVRFKAKIVPALLKNQVAMCLLYSEPGAGSDLAGIRTRADHQGDHFVVNGQEGSGPVARPPPTTAC